MRRCQACGATSPPTRRSSSVVPSCRGWCTPADALAGRHSRSPPRVHAIPLFSHSPLQHWRLSCPSSPEIPRMRRHGRYHFR